MSVADIWASMKNTEASKIAEYKKKTKAQKLIASSVSVSELIRQDEQKKEKKLSKKLKLTNKGAKAVVQQSDFLPNASLDYEETGSCSTVQITRSQLTPQEMMHKISRDLLSSNEEDIGTRRNSLQRLHQLLFSEFTMSDADYNEIFIDTCKTFFKLFADPGEKCREMALRICLSFFERSSNLVPVLGYFIPCLMQRIPSGQAYDEEMKVFVVDMEAHEAYRRGRAVERQDKGGTTGLLTHHVIEPSEEIRLLSCRTLGALLNKVCSVGAASILHPYFHELVLFLQCHLRDPFPDLKIEACNLLALLAFEDEFCAGMKFFAVGLVRAILPVLRHRHAKVRVAAVAALKACMMVPDHAKRKGSGTEAMPDLVGFREDNVLQVAAFYKADIQINYLAEVIRDPSVAVRERVADMLSGFLNDMGDRYDHHTRLLPYILDLLSDEASTVSNIALRCIRACGKEYEDEHPDEIIERRQYGVDGDERINLDKPLPAPFTERPRLGVRLYIRGNTKRFLNALVGELTNWQAQTRVRSACLLKTIVVLCEEHLVMEVHTLLPAYAKALYYANQDTDKELKGILMDVFELVGRYTFPEVYVHYILPRLRGDSDVVQFGTDAPMRVAVMQLLQALISGSRPSQLLAHFTDLAVTLTDPFVIDSESTPLQEAAADVLLTLLECLQGKGKAAVEAHFLNTGRLTSLRTATNKLFRFFLETLTSPVPSLSSKGSRGLVLLAEFETSPVGGVGSLFRVNGPELLNAVMADFDPAAWIPGMLEHRLLVALVASPFGGAVTHSTTHGLANVLCFLCDNVDDSSSRHLDAAVEKEFLCSMSRLVVSCLEPLAVQHSNFRDTRAKSGIYKDLLLTSSTGSGGSETARLEVRQRLTATLLEEASGGISLLRRIVEVFLLHGRWRGDTALLTCRLELFAVMQGYTRPLPCSQILKRDDLAMDVLGPAEDSVATRPTLLEAARLYVITDKSNKTVVDVLMTELLQSSTQPSVTTSVRLSALQLFHSMMSSLSTSQDGIIRILSYAKKRSTLPPPSSSSLPSHRTTGNVFMGSASYLLSLVDDSSDSIRVLVFDTLLQAVALGLVEEDDTQEGEDIANSSASRISDEGDADPAEGNDGDDGEGSLLSITGFALRRGAGAELRFSAVVQRLLREVSVCLAAPELLSSLDSLLRALASLDSQRFEVLLRAQLHCAPSEKSSSEGVATLSEFISDLVNHCDVLQQMDVFSR